MQQRNLEATHQVYVGYEKVSILEVCEKREVSRDAKNKEERSGAQPLFFQACGYELYNKIVVADASNKDRNIRQMYPSIEKQRCCKKKEPCPNHKIESFQQEIGYD